ncbi:MAG: hypothetical protein LBT26_04400 [Clostridiales Family XIII bacterium]|jgi:hypothetical protein|nr:hypothetical protein [Clostridiales Family XIII bacterium]
MKKVGNWLFENGYLLVIVAAAPLVYIWRGKNGFWIFIPIAALIIALQVVMALSRSKKEQQAKMKRREEGLADPPRPAYFTDDDMAEYDEDSVIELSKILTNNNARAVGDIALLVRDYEMFESEHREWCGDVYEDWTESDDLVFSHVNSVKRMRLRILHGFAYWLTGYDAVEDKAQNPPAAFGAYIDWKEGIDDIVWKLDEADRNLGYALELEGIPSAGGEFGYGALQKINDYLTDKGFLLLSLDTDSDCYHLFIIPSEERDRLIRFAAAAGFRFVIGNHLGM